VSHFYKQVDRRSREAMTAFLKNHKRYYTGNSWNLSTSYANCVKVHRLNLPRDIVEKASEIVWEGLHQNYLNWILEDYAREHDYRWQVGSNGRSRGYLVLYQGEKCYKNAHTARCNFCGKRTWHKKEIPCTGCEGGTLKVLATPLPQIKVYPGRGTDEGTNFNAEEWTMDDLRERVALVQGFDTLCDNMREAFISLCRDHEVEEEEYVAVKTRKVLVVG
jgi:hypothetical protein